ncbi:SMP-30/gluconolactonase/LRE family protein [Roseibium marinum]|uniref:Sugar lactone lactonase YvrE n=1 Tax=Roseibium marinum TaxID=281252 RepID=A0A2S3UN21_9HYPH|nr:strictosidine synthase [Roseibium marinum]POF29118.1 sugar lactone lactonase YvrE [Roseibium marinum]
MSTLLSRLFSRRQAATVPPMDGVLRPNEALDELSAIGSIAAPDNLVAAKGKVFFSSGSDLYFLDRPGNKISAEPFDRFSAEITALDASPEGALAVGVDGTGIRIVGGAHDGVVLDVFDTQPVNCVTALAFSGEDELFVCLGSGHNSAPDWQRDLMEKRSSGSLWQVGLKDKKARKLAGNLAFPNGILVRGDKLVVAESWNHRLLSLRIDGEKHAQAFTLADLPGYPGRLAPAANGGAWLSVFAPRGQLTEFVLREDTYRNRMLRELSSEHWIAPTLRAGKAFTEPMQGGAVKVHGVHKAWAPTRSYGLLILLDSNLTPTHSFHSRADGKRHGIVSACELDGDVFIASRGNDVLCTMPVPHSGMEGTS